MFIKFNLFFIVFVLLFNSIVNADQLDTIHLDEILVTPTRMDLPKVESISSIIVIDQATIEQSNLDSVVDIIEQEAGVLMVDTNTPKTARIDIRGFGDSAVSNVLVLIDGRKVNSIDISGPDFIQIPLNEVKQIEIIKGAASILYGDNASAGVVNIITKQGTESPLREIEFDYGSYDQYSGRMNLRGQKNQFKFSLGSQYSESGGYRSNSDLLSKDYHARVGVHFTDRLNLQLNSGWHEDSYGLPGGLNDAELATLGRRASANENDFASTQDRYLHLRLTTAPLIGPKQDIGELLTDISYRNRDTYSLLDFASFGQLATNYHIDTLGINLKYIYDQPINGRNFSVVTGIDFYDIENDIIGSGNGLSKSSDDLTISKQEGGIYAHSEFEFLTDVFLNAGHRYQQADYIFDQRNTSRYEKKNPHQNVSSVGLRYQYAPQSNIHASFEQTFRFLATDEWYSTFSGLNTRLQHQKGKQVQVGIKHRFPEVTTVHLTGFQLDLKDEIYFDPYSVFFGENRNYDKTQRLGFELSQESDWFKLNLIPRFKSFQLDTSYSYIQPEFKGGVYGNKNIPLVPRHLASQGIKFKVANDLIWAIHLHYVGSRFAINDTRNETARIKPQLTFDTRLNYKKDQFKWFLGIENMLDERYFSYVVKSATSNSKDYFPTEGRKFVGGVGWEF